jgi:uncharacterized protein (TIGR02996 family)
MTDEPALLAAIAARPDDDTPRLVYADWLDDHGDADRAEFIRLQCRLAQGGPDDPAAAERADELQERHLARLLAGLPKALGLRWDLRRGFPERLAAEVARLMERYDRVAAVPWLRDLSLTNFIGSAALDFARRPWPVSWVELELWGYDDPDGDLGPFFAGPVMEVAGNPRAGQLRALRLQEYTFSPEQVATLADSPHLAGLHLLAVPGDPDRPLYAPLRARFGDRLVGEGA